MKRSTLVGLALGVAAVTALFVWQGVAAVIETLRQAGWSLLLLCFLEPVTQLFAALRWRQLYPRGGRPPLARMVVATWMGHAVNQLLPVASIGGEVVKARVLTLWTYSAIEAFSTMVVDKTVQAVAVLLWGLVGVVLLVVLVPDDSVWIGAAISALVLAVCIGGFVAIQIAGSFSMLARVAGRFVAAERAARLAGGADRLDAAIRGIYRRPGDFTLSCGWMMARQIWLVSDILLASYLIGQPLGLGEALLLKALVTAIVGISFAVPAGIGFQEGGYVLIGALLGLPPDLMLALSLASRVRDVLPAVPFLLAWQNMERRALARRPPADAGD